jgi:GntR family transcriptional regulator
MLTDAWIPPGLSKFITVAALRKRGLYEILLAQGVRFGRVVQEIGAQSADPMQAAHLEIEVGSPILRVVRLLHDVANRPVQYLTVYTASERSRLLMDIGSESMNSLSSGQFVHDVTTRPRSRSRSGTRPPR